MGLFKDINDGISELLCPGGRYSRREQEERKEKARIESARIEKEARIERQRIEKFEKDTRKKYWLNVKNDLYSKYQLSIADDAKHVAKELFGKDLDTVSAFFITDERVVKQRYIEGGDNALSIYANNIIKRAFIGGPITATLLRRLKLLKDAKRDGLVIDTEIDIDGFPPHGKIFYALKEIELDGQIIPARRKFSIRCEMTATITEGFRTGPFVLYDELYLSTKEDLEQITDEDIETDILNDKEKNKENINISAGKKYGKIYKIEVCPHGTDVALYCSACHGDIIISPSKKKVIGICLDSSGSMHGNRLSAAKRAVIKILERIPMNSNVHIVLIIFDSELTMNYEEIIPFGTEYTACKRNMAINRINDIHAGGGTPLYDAINYFLDGIWPGVENLGDRRFLLDENNILFPYTYLIIVSDGEENQSALRNIIYKGLIGKDAFFAKLKAYRDAGLVTEIMPFAYGEGGTNNRLIRELRHISGKKLINETCPDNIIESLICNVDSILYGTDNLKMMGLSISKQGKGT